MKDLNNNNKKHWNLQEVIVPSNQSYSKNLYTILTLKFSQRKTSVYVEKIKKKKGNI